MEIAGCPYDEIDHDTIEALRIADFWIKGIAPAAGGTLDQTQSITDACDLIWACQGQWKRHLNAHGMDD